MVKAKVSAGVLRRATLIFLPLALASIAIMILLYRAQTEASFGLTRASEQKSVEIAQQRFLAALATVVSDIRYLAHDPTLRRWLSDNNPANTDHLPIGDGLIDWDEFFRVLKAQRYDGYLGLDLGNRPSLMDDLRRSADKLQELAGRHGIQLEK